MKLSEIIQPEPIIVYLESSGKTGVIGELVARLPSAKNPAMAEKILQGVLEKENEQTTGIGSGVAIPHAVVEFPLGLEAAFGLSDRGVDFDSVDQIPARIFFLVVSGREEYGLQIRILARIARLMHNQALVRELTRARSAEEVLAVFREEERQHFS